MVFHLVIDFQRSLLNNIQWFILLYVSDTTSVVHLEWRLPNICKSVIWNEKYEKIQEDHKQFGFIVQSLWMQSALMNYICLLINYIKFLYCINHNRTNYICGNTSINCVFRPFNLSWILISDSNEKITMIYLKNAFKKVGGQPETSKKGEGFKRWFK